MQALVGTRGEIGEGVYLEMLSLRHKIFHERLHWDIPSAIDNPMLEADEFDTPETVYVTVGRPVIACCRLIPTRQKTMISVLWPDVMDNIDPNLVTWELSRFAADKDVRQPGLLAARLLLEAYWFALERRIESYVVISTPAAAKVIRRMGVKTNRLPSMDTSIVASSARIDREVGNVLEALVDTYESANLGGNLFTTLAKNQSGSVVRL